MGLAVALTVTPAYAAPAPFRKSSAAEIQWARDHFDQVPFFLTDCKTHVIPKRNIFYCGKPYPGYYYVQGRLDANGVPIPIFPQSVPGH